MQSSRTAKCDHLKEGNSCNQRWVYVFFAGWKWQLMYVYDRTVLVGKSGALINRVATRSARLWATIWLDYASMTIYHHVLTQVNVTNLNSIVVQSSSILLAWAKLEGACDITCISWCHTLIMPMYNWMYTFTHRASFDMQNLNIYILRYMHNYICDCLSKINLSFPVLWFKGNLLCTISRVSIVSITLKIKCCTRFLMGS